MSDPIIAQSSDGVQHQFPPGTAPGVVDKVMKDYATSLMTPGDRAQAQLRQTMDAHADKSPSIADRIQANPVIGAPVQTLIRAGQGAEQLFAHGAASVSDIGGAAPNTLSAMLHAIADHVDTSNVAQNKGYEEAGARVDAASTDPRVSKALRQTGEVLGNAVNPAGAAGNLVKAAPGLTNAALRGWAGGAGVAASQPVSDTTDYWKSKAEQIGAGSITGAVVGTAAAKLAEVKPDAQPSSAFFKDLSTDSYNASKALGVTLKKSSLEDAINGAEAGARQNITYRPALAPRAAAALATIKDDLANAGPDIGFEEIDVARKIARQALSSPEKPDRAAAHYIIDRLDDYANNLGAHDLSGAATAADSAQAVARLQEARSLFARGTKLDTIERLVEKANDKVGANYTVAGFDTALRQQFGQLKRNQAGWRQFSSEEQDAITQIIRGTPVQNATRQLGKLAPQGSLNILSELGAFGGALYSGHPDLAAGVAGLAGAGALAKKAANQMGEANVNELRGIINRGYISPPPGPTPNGLIWNPLPSIATNAVLNPSPK